MATPPKLPTPGTIAETVKAADVTAVPPSTVGVVSSVGATTVGTTTGGTTTGGTTTGGSTAAAPTTFPVSGGSPTAVVTVPNQSGTVTFSLVVTDNLGQKSAPATVTVTIQSLPTAKITATPPTVAAGGAITLSGAGSTAAAPGTLTNFTFNVVAGT